MRTFTGWAAAASIWLAAAPGIFAATAPQCERLADVKLPHTTIATAQSVAGGKFTPPRGNPINAMPAFCRVAGVIEPTSDSYIRFEVWLPASSWNGKYLGVGNGGFAGTIDYNSLGHNVKRGYATAATDTGHEGESLDATWAFRHPEKIVDFGYRALHETTENAKAIIQTFYNQPPRHSYFDSCSDGGREALMEAQRFPEDFDGILAGAPANYWSHLLAGALDATQGLYRDPVSYIPAAKLSAISTAALAACDVQDGVKDGIINDPQRCNFDPSMLLCKDRDARNCLTEPQIAALKKIYAGSSNSQGEKIFPGLTPGDESGAGSWNAWVIGEGPGASLMNGFVDNYFRYMVFDNPTWNPLTANIDASTRAADEKTAQALNATDPDLQRFAARGGKLILYHGWNDPAISPLNTVNYYNSVIGKMGLQNAQSFIRLYMVPGMQHCVGGPGPSAFGQLGIPTSKGATFGVYAALEQWVENKTTPSGIVATKYVENNPAKEVQMTRPLCPYPEVATYKGSGDTNDYTNFVCTAPARSSTP